MDGLANAKDFSLAFAGEPKRGGNIKRTFEGQRACGMPTQPTQKIVHWAGVYAALRERLRHYKIK